MDSKKKKKKNWNKDLKNYEINFFLISSSDSIDSINSEKNWIHIFTFLILLYILVLYSYFRVPYFLTREKIIWIHLAKKKKKNKK